MATDPLTSKLQKLVICQRHSSLRRWNRNNCGLRRHVCDTHGHCTVVIQISGKATLDITTTNGEVHLPRLCICQLASGHTAVCAKFPVAIAPTRTSNSTKPPSTQTESLVCKSQPNPETQSTQDVFPACSTRVGTGVDRDYFQHELYWYQSS